MRVERVLFVSVIVAAATLIALQEIRLRRQLQELRGETRAGQERNATPQHEASADVTALSELLHTTRSQLLEARGDLAVAKRQLTNNALQIAALERQMQAFARQASAPRLPRSITFTEDGTGVAVDPSPAAARGRPWGEEQVTGPPDTHQAGDISTAWASKLPDAGEEWLKLDYSNTVMLAEVRVRETYNPGAISKVVAVLPNGAEVVLWEGVADPGEAPADTVFPVSANVQAASVKVYLDTRRVRGWNEIDAVELIGRDGSRQWASGASASSSYAER